MCVIILTISRDVKYIWDRKSEQFLVLYCSPRNRLFMVVLLWVLREMYRLFKKRNLGYVAFARENNVNYEATGESFAMDTAV